MAEVFSPVKNVVLALEFIDLPAFQGETLAERGQKNNRLLQRGNPKPI